MTEPTKAEQLEWVRLCRQGLGAKQIADKLGVADWKRIHRHLLARGAYAL
jgi:hypothetical protein